MSRAVPLALALVLAAPAASGQVAVGPESPVCVPRSAPPEVGVELVDESRDGRLVELTLRSSAVASEARFGAPGEQPVYVLLPDGYDPSGETRYPVLYLLHGFSGDYTDYVDSNEIERITEGVDVIVVMPDDGYNGAYVDWYGRVPGVGGEGEPPAWESYHIRELVPFVDEHFPTAGTREGRAVAGISSGGSGAMKYAARYPQLFAAAGSISGAVDITLSRGFGVEVPWYEQVDFFLNTVTLAPGTGPASHCKFGDPYTQKVYWEDNNPTYLASNLRGVGLWASSGDGTDPDDPDTFDGVEWTIRQMHLSFAEALDSAGVPHRSVFRAGTHATPFWIEDLELFVPWVMDRFADPPAPPDTFSHRDMASEIAAWDWSFTATKAVDEFTYLDDVSRGGLTVTGSGEVGVETAPLYGPGETYIVDGAGEVVADPDGRLRFAVDLGPSHVVQQYRFEPEDREDWETRTIGIVSGSS